MACTIQDYGFVVNNNLIGNATCNAYNTDSIDAEMDVTFTSPHIGQSVYCVITFQYPDGHTAPIYANNGNPVIAQATTPFFIFDIIKSTDPLGTYHIQQVTILNSTKSQSICYTTTSAYGCTALTVSVVPITCSVSGYFLVNGNPITGVNCNAGLTDTIDVRCVASFSNSAIGKSFKCGMQIKKPDASYKSKITSLETVTTNTHNFTLSLPYILDSSVSPGVYSTGQADIYSFVIYDSSNVVVCEGTGTGSGNCENLTILSCPAPTVNVSCPSSITQGSFGSIVATIGTPTGTSPYTYKLYRDTEPTPISTYQTSDTSHIFSHTFSEAPILHTFRVDVTDSCTNPGPQTGSGSCSVNVQLSGTCTAPVVNVTCPTTQNQGSTANIVATITTAGTSPYVYKLYIDSDTTPIDIYPTSGTTTNTTHTFQHVLTESTTAHAYKVEVTDSCSSGGLTGVDICSITVQPPGTPTAAGLGTGVVLIAVAAAAVLVLALKKK